MYLGVSHPDFKWTRLDITVSFQWSSYIFKNCLLHSIRCVIQLYNSEVICLTCAQTLFSKNVSSSGQVPILNVSAALNDQHRCRHELCYGPMSSRASNRILSFWGLKLLSSQNLALISVSFCSVLWFLFHLNILVSQITIIMGSMYIVCLLAALTQATRIPHLGPM
jgi:hypothetical protein